MPGRAVDAPGRYALGGRRVGRGRGAPPGAQELRKVLGEPRASHGRRSGRDVVLHEGESFVIDRPGRTVVQALDPSELALNAANDRHFSTSSHTRLKGIA